MTLTGITIADPLTGNEACPATTLAVGAPVMNCTASYTVQQSDIDDNGIDTTGAADGVAGMPGLISAAERLSGYKAALQTYGIAFDPQLVANGNFNQPEGYIAADVLLNLPILPTAIFAANDLSALGVLDAVRNRGLTVPDDMSVMGFDDIQQAAYMRPGLTTIRQPLAEMGQIAVRMLLEYIEKPDLPMRRVEVETELMIRETCCPPKTS